MMASMKQGRTQASLNFSAAMSIVFEMPFSRLNHLLDISRYGHVCCRYQLSFADVIPFKFWPSLIVHLQCRHHVLVHVDQIHLSTICTQRLVSSPLSEEQPLCHTLGCTASVLQKFLALSCLTTRPKVALLPTFLYGCQPSL